MNDVVSVASETPLDPKAEYEQWSDMPDNEKMRKLQSFFSAAEWKALGVPQRERNLNIYDNYLCLREAGNNSLICVRFMYHITRQ